MQDREKIEHIFIDIRSKEHDLSYRFIKRERKISCVNA